MFLLREYLTYHLMVGLFMSWAKLSTLSEFCPAHIVALYSIVWMLLSVVRLFDSVMTLLITETVGPLKVYFNEQVRNNQCVTTP